MRDTERKRKNLAADKTYGHEERRANEAYASHTSDKDEHEDHVDFGARRAALLVESVVGFAGQDRSGQYSVGQRPRQYDILRTAKRVRTLGDGVCVGRLTVRMFL